MYIKFIFLSYISILGDFSAKNVDIFLICLQKYMLLSSLEAPSVNVIKYLNKNIWISCGV